MNGKELAFAENSGGSSGGIIPFEVEWNIAYQQEFTLTKSNFSGTTTSAEFEMEIGDFSTYHILFIYLPKVEFRLATPISSQLIFTLWISSTSITPYQDSGICNIQFNENSDSLCSCTDIFTITNGRIPLPHTDSIIGVGNINTSTLGVCKLGLDGLKWIGNYTTYASNFENFTSTIDCTIYGGKFKT